ncbi:MAG: hypothetical protein ABR536_05995, partial [Solirubrobacterales bacterium]
SEPDRLRDQASRVPESSLIAAIDSLSAAAAAIREGDDPRLSLEVALLKVARPSLDASKEALLRRIERLEEGVEGSEGPAAGGGPPLSKELRLGGGPPPTTDPTPPPKAFEPQTPETSGLPTRDPLEAPPQGPPEAKQEAPPAVDGPAGEAPDASPAVSVEQEGALPAGPPPTAGATGIDLERVTKLWPAVVEHLRESGSEVLSSVFEGARPLRVDNEKSVLSIGFPASATFNKRKAEARANVDHLAGSLKAIVGQSLRPVYELLDADAEEAADKLPVVSEEELLELIKTKFDAREVEGQVSDQAQRRAEG